jgi:hypothetical protein
MMELMEEGLLVTELKFTKKYREEMDGRKYEEWFDYVFPCLEVNVFLIMANAPYLTIRMDKVSTKFFKKTGIQD